MWNNYRMARIIIHEMLMTVNAPDTSLISASLEHCSQFLKSKEIQIRIALGICHTVPFFFGFVTESTSGHSDLYKENYAHVAMPGGYLLIWPLYVAGMLQINTLEQRAWFANQLKTIGCNLGVRQAIELSISLSRDMERSFLSAELWSYE